MKAIIFYVALKGMSECTLKYRLNSGWDVACALEAPLRRRPIRRARPAETVEDGR